MSPSFFPSSIGVFASEPEPDEPLLYEPPDHSDLIPVAYEMGRKAYISAVYRARFYGRSLPDHVDLAVAMAALDRAELPPAGALVTAYCEGWVAGRATEKANEK